MTLLSGMSNLEQVTDNLKTINNFEPLSEKEVKLIEMVTEKIRNRILVPCTDCKYCLPCPQNVNIPKNFAKLNELYRYDRLSEWPHVGDLVMMKKQSIVLVVKFVKQSVHRELK